MKTTVLKNPGENRTWYLIDAKDQVLGRLAVKIANVIRGKNKPTFSPAYDDGDFVVVINAEKIRVTGKKEDMKIYQRFSGWRDGQVRLTTAEVRSTHPDRMIKLAVERMMPKNTLSRLAHNRLRVYAGQEHPHAAQNPQKIEVAKS